MHTFLQRVATKYRIEPVWEALRRWSIEHSEQFWPELLEFAAVEPSRPAQHVRLGSGMLDTKWFVGITLNYARHLLRFDDERTALIYENERGQAGRLTQQQLRAEVARCAAAFRRDGVRQGDRVAGYMPNVPETIIAMLAAASLGAIWSSCSPDFGTGGVLDRFGQIEPTVLVAPDGYTYNGKAFETLTRVGELLPQLRSVRRTVIVPCLEERPNVSGLLNATVWREYLGAAKPPPLTFEEVAFDHPLFIMYSSGTTGAPKCIVHGHGGTLLQHMKELMLHTDLRAGENLFYFTTCGWMMWNWLVSGLGAGAGVVLYEGNPAYPDVHRLWKLAAQTPIHAFGTSPKYISVCQKADLHPGREHDLTALRAVLSTGSPLSAEQFRWVYENVKQDLQLASISGGTDIISCFMLGNPMVPVYESELQCRGLGLDVQAWDDRGQPVVGKKGELVCVNPFPCQPVCFWNDPDGSKYRSAYFEHYPNVWRHGDFIEISPTGGVVVYGRSDATLNPGGVRIGTGEIYRLVEQIPEVVDSIVVGKNAANDVEVALFVVLRPGQSLTDELQQRIRQTIASGASKRHVPRHIRQVSQIPHTRNGKKVELAVVRVIHGEPVTNRDALANPEALDEFVGILPN